MREVMTWLGLPGESKGGSVFSIASLDLKPCEKGLSSGGSPLPKLWQMCRSVEIMDPCTEAFVHPLCLSSHCSSEDGLGVSLSFYLQKRLAALSGWAGGLQVLEGEKWLSGRRLLSQPLLAAQVSPIYSSCSLLSSLTLTSSFKGEKKRMH